MEIVCPKCKRVLSENDFYKNKNRRPFGLSYKCKECHSENVKASKDLNNAQRRFRRHYDGVNSRYNGQGTIAKKGCKKSYNKQRYTNNGQAYAKDWDVIRKIIYKRDGWICQECGIKCHNSAKKKIQCHHIDYNVGNNGYNNLITLCASCHSKTNFSRQEWISYFQNKERTRI